MKDCNHHSPNSTDIYSVTEIIVITEGDVVTTTSESVLSTLSPNSLCGLLTFEDGALGLNPATLSSDCYKRQQYRFSLAKILTAK